MDRQFKITIKSYEQEVGERPEEEKYDGFYDYTENLKASYSDCFLKSGFILSYSTIEVILKEFCDIARKEFKIIRSWKDIQDEEAKGEMPKMVKYIERELNIKIDRQTFKILNAYRLTRNLIVHELGELKGNKSKLCLKTVYQHNKNIRFDTNQIIIESSKFLSEFSKFAYETLSDIENKLNLVYHKKH
jgi:hypothetical protein